MPTNEMINLPPPSTQFFNIEEKPRYLIRIAPGTNRVLTGCQICSMLTPYLPIPEILPTVCGTLRITLNINNTIKITLNMC